jgi:UPF0176 protein
MQQEPKVAIKKRTENQKKYVGKRNSFYPKPSIGQFLIEENEINIEIPS